MRRPPVLIAWAIVALALAAAALLLTRGAGEVRVTQTRPATEARREKSDRSEAQDNAPAFAVTAADYQLDAPRRRSDLGQALPFREARLAAGDLPSLTREAFTLRPFPGTALAFRVTGRWDDGNGRRVAARLEGGGAGDRLFLSDEGRGVRGLVELPSRNIAYEIAPGPDGSWLVREWLFTDVVCGTPHPAGDSADRGIPRPENSGAKAPVARIAPGEVPILNSRPGATGVIYIDFDGETVSGTAWAGGATIAAPAARMNVSQVRETWERVVRDFENFTVNITTDPAVYNAAPATARTRCIVTSNDAAAPGAGGVAYIGSFSSGIASQNICWSFIDLNAKDCAEVVSHEAGHTLGLSHDGRAASGGLPRDEYYEGHGSGPTGWAPIMGVGYYRELVQWSKGEYPRANNPEDDLAIISQAGKAPYPADDHGSTIALATAVTGDRADGVVERNTDADFFRVTLTAGAYTLALQPSAFSNLKSELQVQRADGTIVATGSQTGALSATASFTLAAGETVYLRVRGTGEGAVGGTGFSNYGSLGTYNVTGFGNQEQPPSAPIGLTASRISGTQLRINWTANPSAASYNVYRDGVLVATVNGTEFLDATVQPSTEYSYAVVATNAYGPSPASNPTVITSPAFDEFIMDGSPDFAGYLVSNPGMTVYAAVRGTKLYVATWSPGDNNSGFGSDHHIFVSDTLLASATTPAPWAKRGLIAVPGNKPYLAGESATNYAGWFNTAGAKFLFKAPVNSGVMEGVIDLVAEFGSRPANIYVAAVAYQTDDAGVSPPNSGKVNAQAPAGNGNDNLEPAEFLRIPVPQVADAAQNGTYDILAPERAFAINEVGFNPSFQPVLRWRVVPGRSYNVQRRGALNSGNWTTLLPASRTAAADQWEMSYTDTESAPGARQFYRVIRP